MDDAIEPELLAALRASPGDEATRAVYADWLEQHGFGVLAQFVRGEDAAGVEHASDWQWREITSRAAATCEREACPGAWDRFAPTDRARVRSCATCGEFPIYSRFDGEARAAGTAKHPTVFDRPTAPLAEAFDHGRQPWKYGTYNPPAPGRYRPPPVVDEPFVAACKLLDDLDR